MLKFSFLFVSYDSSLKNLLKLLFHMLCFYSLSALSWDRALFACVRRVGPWRESLAQCGCGILVSQLEGLNLLMIGHYII